MSQGARTRQYIVLAAASTSQDSLNVDMAQLGVGTRSGEARSARFRSLPMSATVSAQQILGASSYLGKRYPSDSGISDHNCRFCWRTCRQCKQKREIERSREGIRMPGARVGYMLPPISKLFIVDFSFWKRLQTPDPSSIREHDRDRTTSQLDLYATKNSLFRISSCMHAQPYISQMAKPAGHVP